MPDKPPRPPRPPAKTVSTWMTLAEYRRLQEAAAERAQTVSALIRSILKYRPPPA